MTFQVIKREEVTVVVRGFNEFNFRIQRGKEVSSVRRVEPEG